MKKLLIIAISFLSVPQLTFAHCPLCTVGAGIAGGFAVWLGVSQGVVGIFIGAFGFAVGLLIGKKIKKVPNGLVGFASYVLTVLPAMMLFEAEHPILVSFLGDYGTVYSINQFLIGSLIGLAVLLFSPVLSRKIKKLRGRSFPFQTMTITFFLLFLVAIISEIFIF